jgi:small subunit ribosomal protein S17
MTPRDPGDAGNADPERATLRGYINPLNITPSFVVPVFGIGNRLVLQESNQSDRISGFCPFDESILGELKTLSLDISAGEGDEVFYGFVFPTGRCAVGSQGELAGVLDSERAALSEYPFLYLEVLNFLAEYKEVERQLETIQKTYADNRLLGKKWVRGERRILEKKTSEPRDLLDDAEHAKSHYRASKRAQKVGTVSSDKMTKTVIVRVDRIVKHPKYRRYVRRTSKFMAHDELGASIGDKVRIVETRPLSARKRWRVVEIIRRGGT